MWVNQSVTYLGELDPLQTGRDCLTTFFECQIFLIKTPGGINRNTNCLYDCSPYHVLKSQGSFILRSSCEFQPTFTL
jgi:hypothetical protein